MNFAHFVTALFVLGVVGSSDNVRSLQDSAAYCSVPREDVNHLKKHVKDSSYFCTYWLGTDRTHSPLPGLTPSNLAGSCQCLLEANKKPIPALGSGNNRSAASVPHLPWVTCNANAEAVLKAQFTYPEAFCQFLETLHKSHRPISSLSVLQLVRGCKCLRVFTSKTQVSTASPNGSTSSSTIPTTTSTTTAPITTTATITTPTTTTTTTTMPTTTTTTSLCPSISPFTYSGKLASQSDVSTSTAITFGPASSSISFVSTSDYVDAASSCASYANVVEGARYNQEFVLSLDLASGTPTYICQVSEENSGVETQPIPTSDAIQCSYLFAFNDSI